MSKGVRKCKVCGKEYPYCKTITNDRFRYQDVACSPQCGAVYFSQIQASRESEKTDIKSAVINAVIDTDQNNYAESAEYDSLDDELYDIDDESDDDFDNDLDDEDDNSTIDEIE